MDALDALRASDKAWVSAALAHLRKMFREAHAGGRVPEGSVPVTQDLRRKLSSFDLGKCVGLEMAPSLQQLAELFLCSHGEEVKNPVVETCVWRFYVLGRASGVYTRWLVVPAAPASINVPRGCS